MSAFTNFIQIVKFFKCKASASVTDLELILKSHKEHFTLE